MSKFAKGLGFLVISVFLVSIPFLTGLLLGVVGEFDFFTLLGLVLTLGEVGWVVSLFCEHE